MRKVAAPTPTLLAHQLMTDLIELESQTLAAIDGAGDESALEAVRVGDSSPAPSMAARVCDSSSIRSVMS